jgi:hypothetical protein
MTFTFTAVVKATAAKFNFAACSRHAKCSFRVRLHTNVFKKKMLDESNIKILEDVDIRLTEINLTVIQKKFTADVFQQIKNY